MQNPTNLIHQFLGERYPHLFAKGVYVPLAIGTASQIISLHLEEIKALLSVDNDKKTAFYVKKAIGGRCRKRAYLEKMLEENAMRVGLDGKVAGPVIQEHKQSAIAMINAKNQRKLNGAKEKSSDC